MSIFDFMRNKSLTTLSMANLSPLQIYERLDEYYNNNSLYDGISYTAAYNNLYLESLKGLRTPVHRSIEFFVNKVASNKPIVTANKDAVKQAIEQFHLWTGLEQTKRLAVRGFALYGDLFWKINTDANKVYAETINPKLVTDFEVDSRGNITEIRIDTEIEIDERQMTHSEYWTLGENGTDGYMAIYEHNMGSGVELEQLGTPKEYYALTEFGITFIPIVHCKFVDTGKKRGESAVAHSLLKIDDLNRVATRLEQMLFRFNKPIFSVSSNSNDANGRPIPAPRLNDGKSTSDSIDLKDGSMFYLPGNATLNSMIPNINYDSALNIMNSIIEEVEKDMPELRWYSIKDSNLSGKAIRTLLASAIAKAEEAQDNFIASLIKLDMIALTMGAYLGFFKNIGTYENGDFTHSISFGEIFPIDALEKAQTLKELTQAGLPLGSAMLQAGYDENQIADALKEKTADEQNKQNAITNSLMNDVLTNK